jgi:hypothetical protein
MQTPAKTRSRASLNGWRRGQARTKNVGKRSGLETPVLTDVQPPREQRPTTIVPATEENGRESVTRSPARTSALPSVDAAPEGAAECRSQPLGATGSGV